MKKAILTFCALACAACLTAGAENITRVEEFASFKGISAGDSFDITLKTGLGFSVEYTVDSRIIDYCSVYVQGDILSFNIDEKSFPKELKAQLRGKEKNVTMIATVTIPEHNDLDLIKLSDQAVMNSTTPFKTSGTINIAISDNASLKSMRVSAATVKLDASNKGKMNIVASASKVEAHTANNSYVDLEADAPALELITEGASSVAVSGKASTAKIQTSFTSSVSMKGAYDKLNIDAKNFSKVNALSANANDVEVVMNSCECSVNAVNSLRLTLQGGAKLTFDGEPSVYIDKIISSTVKRERDNKKKK